MEANNKNYKIHIIAVCIAIMFVISIIALGYILGKYSKESSQTPIDEIKEKCIKFNRINLQYGELYGNLTQEEKQFIFNNCV